MPVYPGALPDTPYLGQSVAWDDKHQNSARLQPAIRVAKERLLCATTVRRPKGSIVRWIQIQQAKALNRALHFRRISLQDIGTPLPGLVGAVGIKLDAITKHVGATGDRLKRYAIGNAWVDRRRRLIGKWRSLRIRWDSDNGRG
jgi:hypothetical protein